MVTTFVWLAIAVFFGIVEAMGPALICIWFCIGAAVAFVASFFVKSILVQVIVFLVVSLAALIGLRPFIRASSKEKLDEVKTNYDTYVGREVVVSQAIPAGMGSTGRVTLAGVSWLARTVDGSPIERDARVVVNAVESTVLVVAPV